MEFGVKPTARAKLMNLSMPVTTSELDTVVKEQAQKAATPVPPEVRWWIRKGLDHATGYSWYFGFPSLMIGDIRPVKTLFH